MHNRVSQHHRATLRHIAQLKAELDVAIRRARELADDAPGSEAFHETLANMAALDARIQAARQLATALNAMLPRPEVRLVPPAPERFPTPHPHRGRSWARVVHMPARPPRDFDTPN